MLRKIHFDINIFSSSNESAINGRTSREVLNIQYTIIHNCAVYKNIFIRNKRVELVQHGRGEVEDSHNVYHLCKNGT
jgi:hypothetical protein